MEEGKQDHFWDHTQAASTCIVDIDEQGASIHGRDHDGYRHVPVVKNAWAHIIRAYFPSRAAVPRGRRYATEYRPGPERAVVARALEGPGPAPPGQPPERCTAGRDRLWAVCGAAPGGDAPAGWAALMGEALGGLGRARGPGAEGGPRKVFFVLAMGMVRIHVGLVCFAGLVADTVLLSSGCHSYTTLRLRPAVVACSF